jgi:hypothetical protein
MLYSYMFQPTCGNLQGTCYTPTAWRWCISVETCSCLTVIHSYGQKEIIITYLELLNYWTRKRRLRWPSGLWRVTAAACLVRLWVRVPAVAWMSVVLSVLCCQVEVSSSGWSLVQESPTDCDVSECDREAWIMRRAYPTRGCAPWDENNWALNAAGCTTSKGKLSLFVLRSIYNTVMHFVSGM